MTQKTLLWTMVAVVVVIALAVVVGAFSGASGLKTQAIPAPVLPPDLNLSGACTITCDGQTTCTETSQDQCGGLASTFACDGDLSSSFQSEVLCTPQGEPYPGTTGSAAE